MRSRIRQRAVRILKASREPQSVDALVMLEAIAKDRPRSKNRSWKPHVVDQVFAAVIASSRRAHGLEHYPVQVMAGLDLVENRIVEMQTGEGKTLTAVLPIAVWALERLGCHVLTANDYLAKRDAQFAGAILGPLGIQVGFVQADMDRDARFKAYQCDITYGTGVEMGFDYLRDRLIAGPRCAVDEVVLSRDARADMVQRGQHYALVDEADHLLIDDATTPLLISLEAEEPASRQALYRWAHEVSLELSPSDFHFDPHRREANLSGSGVRALSLRPKPVGIIANSKEDMLRQVETSLVARLAFTRDRDYIVGEDGITLISESTGRKMEGRKWQRGLQFAVEAKEGIEFGKGAGNAARISVQSYFRLYQKLAGMTGTGWLARHEIKKYYHRRVTIAATHRPCVRRQHRTRVFTTKLAKYHAIIEEIQALTNCGRAVLVGTPSVSASEELSRGLRMASVEHVVLNAVQHEEEAEVVATAGQPKAVTIATNMAGRGTDIQLASSVRDAGGLHVIATELHSSARIDRQLIGRAARQGDPGSFRLVLSLEDELLRHVPKLRRQLQHRSRGKTSAELPRWWIRYFKIAQRQVEKSNRRARWLAHEAAKAMRDQARKAGLDPCLDMIATDEE